ncbi:DUF1496 domain-containing protein [Serratia rubidaea]|nr:DUF1496 domain-containing protein [Serratia rubidaea]
MNYPMPLAIAVAGMLFSSMAGAHRGDVDVVLPVAPEIWGAAKSTAAPAPCLRCCIYQDQNYSEGALLKVEGELLQCQRDKTQVGTYSLIWVRLNK